MKKQCISFVNFDKFQPPTPSPTPTPEPSPAPVPVEAGQPGGSDQLYNIEMEMEYFLPQPTSGHCFSLLFYLFSLDIDFLSSFI